MIQLISAYFTLNLLLLLAAGALTLIGLATRHHSHRSLLRLHYVTLFILLGFALLQPAIPRPPIFTPVAKVWSAPSLRSFNQTFKPDNAFVNIPGRSENTKFRTDRLSLTLALALAALFLFTGAQLFRDLRRLSRLRQSAFPLRKIGRVRIYTHETLTVPFSFRAPRAAEVFLPSYLLGQPEQFRLALKHELQHHRQGDTLWAYVLLALKTFCAPNPAIHLWIRRLHEIQEFACDEAVLGQRKVNSQAYARCLFEVAEQAFHRERIPACATGFSLPVGRNLTKRRIESMMHSQNRKQWKIIPYCAALALALATTAYAASSLVQDRRVNLTQAQAMAEKAQASSEFPIVVNELVLAQLNRYMGTPEGRDFIRASLARMENYRGMIEGKIAEYDMPLELLAVPLIESGYENLAESGKYGHGAGLWMFIKSTARNYGLRVDNQVDERLNTELLTDAAMRYWQSNYLRFRDWQLAALSYNMGENAVQKAISETGSRDAWTLIRAGYENDHAYLARLMAAILIMKNPGVLK